MMALILNLIFSGTAFAYPCPDAYGKLPEAQKTHIWLKKFKGVTGLHGCEIEITYCDPLENTRSGSPIGEVFVATADGREGYLSIDFEAGPNHRFETQVKHYTRALWYLKRDRFYEEENGRTEVWRFEMQTLWDETDILDVLELGIYTTNSALNEPNGNDSHWYICKGKL